MNLDIRKIINLLKKHKLYINSKIEKDIIEINDITIDSRHVQANDVFVAIEGFEVDGHKFINKAIESGARLIIHTKDEDVNANSILVSNSRKAGALIASEIYDRPSEKLKLIGITGTNGKTTSSTLVYDILNKMGIKCGVIGTLGYSFGKEIIPLNRTTPDISELNRILAEMVKEKCQAVVMEVSSHSLVLDRVYGQKFSAIGFTNLTQDHLDFHSTFENYFLAKKILFDTAEKMGALAVINTDDKYGKKYFQDYKQRKLAYGFDLTRDVYASEMENRTDSTGFKLHYSNLTYNITTNYIGEFNVYNLMLAVTLCKEVFPELEIKEDILKNLKRTNGRLEPITSQALGKVFIDYAHTPDAIEQVLKTLDKTQHDRLITVVGCGGDRDREKRSPMAQIACKRSDLVIFTDDNPRRENRNLIIADMVEKLYFDNYFIIRDRKIAIETALKLSRKEDIVIILGKGHENYQEVDGIKHHLSDSEEVSNYIPRNDKRQLALPYDIINLLDLKFKYEGLFDRSKFEDIPNLVLKQISTDSRNIEENSLFIALKGDNFDGNDYIEKLHESSSNCFTIGEIANQSNLHLQVNNALHYYGYMAKRYLKLFDIKKIALTGSTGKTTTKEILTNILEESHQVLKTHGNENNYIGLPRTIFRIKDTDVYAVFEIGTNSFGEIAYLSDIIEPDYALITSVDEAHLEKLQSLEGVYKEKTSLFRRKLNKFLFPGDNALFAEFKSQEFRGTAYSVGLNADNSFVYHIKDISDERMTIEINNSHYEVNNLIPYFGLNYALAISLAKLLEVNINDVIYGLLKKLNISNRMNIIKGKNRIIIADCYNANPRSTKAAIDFWINYLAERKHIAVLGDMLELGENEEKLHLDVKNKLEKLTNIRLYTVGKLTKLYNGQAHFDKIEDLIKSDIISELSEGVILIKGSHGIHLEKILEIV